MYRYRLQFEATSNGEPMTATRTRSFPEPVASVEDIQATEARRIEDFYGFSGVRITSITPL